MDLGFIPAGRALEMTTQTLGTLDKLPRHRGHFYNWYDTKTLEALRPLYVSTVDSGNMAGFLLTVAAGFYEMGGRAIFSSAAFSGLEATLNVIAEVHRATAGKSGAQSTEILRPFAWLCNRPR